MARPMVLEEVTGLRRAIILRGTSMPFQPLEIGIEQRVSTTHYAGNKVGYQRVTGARFLNTTVNGRWDEKNMRTEDRPDLIGFGVGSGLGPPPSPGALQGAAGLPSGTKAESVRDIVNALVSICAAGSRLRMEWGQTVMYGRLKRFVPRWKHDYQAEWEAEFEWIGDSQDQPVPKAPIPSVTSWSATLQAYLKKLLDAADTLAGYAVWGYVESSFGDVTAIADEVARDLALVVSTVLAPLDSLSTIRASYERLRLTLQQLVDDLEARTAGIDEATQRNGDGAAISAATLRIAQRIAEVMMEEAMLRQAEVDAVLEKQTLAVYRVPEYMSLRQVAVKFYGSPDSWPAIQAHNNLSSSIVTPGQEIKIPRLS